MGESKRRKALADYKPNVSMKIKVLVSILNKFNDQILIVDTIDLEQQNLKYILDNYDGTIEIGPVELIQRDTGNQLVIMTKEDFIRHDSKNCLAYYIGDTIFKPENYVILHDNPFRCLVRKNPSKFSDIYSEGITNEIKRACDNSTFRFTIKPTPDSFLLIPCSFEKNEISYNGIVNIFPENNEISYNVLYTNEENVVVLSYNDLITSNLPNLMRTYLTKNQRNIIKEIKKGTWIPPQVN